MWWSHRDFSKPCCGKDFQNLQVKLKFSIRKAVTTRPFVTCKTNIFKLGIFSFNSYVYYLNLGSIASTRVFNLLTRAFSVPTRVINLATRAFSLLTRGFELTT